MTAYRFKVGERVTYCEKRFPMGTWTTELVVFEHLKRDGTPQYRLRDSSREYVVAEDELFPSVEERQRERCDPSPWSA